MDPLLVHLLASRRPGRIPDLRLAGRLFLPTRRATGSTARRAPGLVVGHGAGSCAANHEDFCLEACRRGFAVLAIDFRGHGDSEGAADGPLELDILAAVRFLREHPAVDPGLVCYRGSSMGGFYGLKAAPLANFAAAVLLCPAGEDVILDTLGEDSAPTTGGGKTDGRPAGPVRPRRRRRPLAETARWDRPQLQAYFSRQDSRRLAARVGCPVLLIHARHDRQVPFDHSLLLARHLRTDTTLVALKEGGHTTAQHDPSIHRYSLAWLCERVEETKSEDGRQR